MYVHVLCRWDKSHEAPIPGTEVAAIVGNSFYVTLQGRRLLIYYHFTVWCFVRVWSLYNYSVELTFKNSQGGSLSMWADKETK